MTTRLTKEMDMQRPLVSRLGSGTRAALVALSFALAAGCGEVIVGPDLGNCEMSGTCGNACTKDTDCAALHPGTPRSEVGSMMCVQCLADGDCPLGQLCEQSTHVCADACNANRGCGD